MLRLTLAQMRRSLGRLVAAAIAIVIGTAFVAATLLAGNAITRTTYDAVTTGYGDADLVVSGGELTDTAAATLAEVAGVAAVQPYAETWMELAGPSGQTFAPVRAAATHAQLETAVLTSGELPTRAGQIVLPESATELLGVAVGDTVTTTLTGWATDEPEALVTELELTGITDSSGTTFLTNAGTGVVATAQFNSWVAFEYPTEERQWYSYLLVALDADASVPAVQDAARQALPSGIAVRTLDEQAERTTAELTGSADVLLALVLGFAAVALLVAALVIANTFQVLVAQRTRTLALLRCVGADRAQLRRSVTTEALLLGVTSSALGVALGTGVVQLALVILNRSGTDVPLPEAITMTPAVIIAPLIAGTLVTMLAALAPARAATRVSPLAALRPTDPPRVTDRGGRLRLVFSVLLIVGGLAGLGLGTVVAREVDLMAGLGLGVLGGMLSFVGVLIGAIFWVPRLVGRVGSLLTIGGRPTARLAAANSIRNPRRTASTSAALFIGVTLVAMMSTGAASARSSLDESLQAQYPVDVSIGTMGNGFTSSPLPSGVTGQVAEIDGVTQVTELTGVIVEIVDGAPEAEGLDLEARGVDVADVRAVLQAPEQVGGLDETTVVVPSSLASWTGIDDGAELTLRVLEASTSDAAVTDSPAGTATVTVTRTAVVTDLPGQAVVMTTTSLAELAPDAPVNRLWVRLAGLDGAEQAVADISATASDSGTSLSVVGAAVERAFFQRVVNTLLAVVVGLLGVAVVIALVGVTNTLSLSVIERRRESATLRAIGLSRQQLRGTLAIEGVLIAGVGAVVGAVLGTVYGWVGAQTLLGEVAQVGLTIPWRDLAIVVVVSLLAGLLASVIPGRSAARTSPVEALAVE